MSRESRIYSALLQVPDHASLSPEELRVEIVTTRRRQVRKVWSIDELRERFGDARIQSILNKLPSIFVARLGGGIDFGSEASQQRLGSGGDLWLALGATDADELRQLGQVSYSYWGEVAVDAEPDPTEAEVSEAITNVANRHAMRDRLVVAYNTACDRLDRDPVPSENEISQILGGW